MRINKKIYNYIDFELSNYKTYESKIEEIRKNIIDSSPPPADGQPKGNKISNPTLNKVIELSTPIAISRMEFNKQCIDRALKKLDQVHNNFFERNYIKEESIVKICNEMPIGERTYYRLKGKIIEYVAREMGML